MIELLVVVIIVGVLASISFPQYFRIVEKGKIQEAINVVNAAGAAQNRYVTKYNTYCTGVIASCNGFDLTVPTMKYFGTPTSFLAGAGTPSWKVALTRIASVPIYGNYVVTYTVEPNAAPVLTCSQTNCSAELLPR